MQYLALALSAATLVITILIAIRLKTVHYLLQQPVVKKLSPQLRLKPVKLDDAGNRVRDGRDGDRRGLAARRRIGTRHLEPDHTVRNGGDRLQRGCR